MCEDIQLTAHQILQGQTIGYCPGAMFYDEQPSSFRVSFFQRLRWAKGNLQIFRPYGKDLLRGAVLDRDPSCFDAMMAVLPAVVLTIASGLAAGSGILWWMLTGTGGTLLLQTLIPGILGGYGVMLLVGGITLLTEGDRIHATGGQKLRALVTFPIFMATYMPIAICALFAKVQWRPIPHRRTMTLREVEGSGS
jgi:cellulose synthase/poly-beta-1,6-N-acetylglucosamine synthase-like glycosyltransferase